MQSITFMKYALKEEYFETPLFQETVQAYFDTVLQVIWQDYILLPKNWTLKMPKFRILA
ncbi:hypothetical protein M23134_06481 [Microscilla marina ATCC 23134]|uniref:Uncharacterized protein n=2 Tax=Microscilla marina TaxID=1027 RepID=A1ZYS0_MICM2|nr:hypothetical protein M23134_06481 [Microscilla marina ATCC 23134]